MQNKLFGLASVSDHTHRQALLAPLCVGCVRRAARCLRSRCGGCRVKRYLAVLPAAAVLVLAGCIGTESASAPSGQDTNSATTVPRSPTVTPPAAPRDEATVLPVPEAADASQTDALSAAEKVLSTFGQPELAYDEWIAALYPVMTQSGAAAYEGTDPTTIPVRHITGTGEIMAGSTEVALIVQVPTDAGLYNVSLSRPSATAVWLADRIRPAGA